MFRSGFFTSDSWTVNGDGFAIGNKSEGSDFLAKIVAVAVSDGVPYLPTSNLQVTATTGMILSVGAGFGFKDGYMAWETADTTITCTSSASEQTLYISARLDTTTGEFTGGKVDKYTTFVAATDICFAIVVIPANAVTITNSMITDVRGNATYCGYITDQREYLEDLVAWLQNEIAKVMAGGMPDHATTHNVGGDDELSFVSYEAQTLTSGQKAQALKNIGSTPNDGWVSANESWTYASATTITVPSGAASKYQKGDKIKLTQTTVKYFSIIGVADTTLTVTAGSSYTLANAAITENYYSKVENPLGFPPYFTLAVTNWTTNGTAFTNQPTSDGWRFEIRNSNCRVYGTSLTHGTSGGTGVFNLNLTAGQLPATADSYGRSVNLSTLTSGFAITRTGVNNVINIAKYDGSTIAGNTNYFGGDVTYAF